MKASFEFVKESGINKNYKGLKIETPDAQNILLTWPEPQDPIMDNKVCNPKIAPAAWLKAGEFDAPVGSGPYTLDAEGTTTGSVYAFTKNANHWDTANYPYEKLLVKVITSDTAAVRISATVTNTGDRDGAVVVQLYLRVNTIGVTRPAQQLGGFTRVELATGEQRRVTFAVDATQLAYTNLMRDIAVEPARVDVFVGLDSDDRAVEDSSEITGASRVLSGTERSFLSAATSELITEISRVPR